MKIEGSVVVVTGAASGIGRGLAQAFAENGARLVLADIEQGALDTAVAELEDGGFEATSLRADVRDFASVCAVRDHADATFGGADIVCNNAGVLPPPARAWEVPEDDLEWILRVNLYGVINGVRAFVPGMIERGRPGYLVNTASMNALAPVGQYASYSMSKGANVAFSETLAIDLAEAGASIGVSVLLPEMIKSNLGTAERNRADADASKRAFPPGADPFSMMGLEPTELAARVVSAVRDERFWILPPADDPFMQQAIERFHTIEGASGSPQP